MSSRLRLCIEIEKKNKINEGWRIEIEHLARGQEYKEIF
jgi:hypothetical protein